MASRIFGWLLFTMKHIQFFLLIIIQLHVFSNQLPDTQIKTKGQQPITHFKPSMYRGSDEIWDITQDDTGQIYIGTSHGIHQYNGNSWKSIPGIGSGIKTFHKLKSGKIFVFSDNNYGEIITKNGKQEFSSLRESLPDSSSFGTIISVLEKDSTFYIAGMNGIIQHHIHSNQAVFHPTVEWAFPSFDLDNKVYFQIQKQGVMEIENDTLRLTSKTFKSERGMDAFVFQNEQYLLTSNFSIYKILSKDSSVLVKNLAPISNEIYPYKIHNYHDKYIIINTIGDGVYIYDNLWNLIKKYNDSNGLHKTTYNTFIDKKGDLWVSTPNGAFYVNLNTNYSQYIEGRDFEGTIYDIEFFKNQLLLATSQGIFIGNESDSTPFLKIPNSDLYNDDILVQRESALIKSGISIGHIQNNNYERIFTKSTDFSTLAAIPNTDLAITLGGKQTLTLFKRTGETWSHSHDIVDERIPDKISYLSFDPIKNQLWCSNSSSLFKFRLDPKFKGIEEFTTFNQRHGLSNTKSIFIMIDNNELLFLGTPGIYSYNEKLNEFELVNRFEVINHLSISQLAQIKPNEYWFTGKKGQQVIKGKLSITKGEAHLDTLTLSPLNANITTIRAGLKQSYIGSNQSLTIVDNIPDTSTYQFLFTPLIQSISLIGPEDSTIHIDNSSKHKRFANGPIVIPILWRNIRINYSIPSYGFNSSLQYQYQLEGFDKEWSRFSTANQKEYTNLPSGDYTFKIRAKNIYGVISTTGICQFSIPSPWHQTAWAYGFYTLLFGGFIYGLVYLNSRRLKAENLRLEGIISERTSEILDQKSTIEKALKERESLLKEIHHRVKNNLQIIASLLYLQSGKFENADFKKVLEEGQGRVRSMALIHQKLYENEDLKSIPFGEYLDQLLGEIKASFGAQAANIEVEVASENIYFDVEMAVPLGLIVNELATNAFKYAFREKGEGRFSISLQRKSNSQFLLQISDNGCGLPDEIDIRKTKSLGLRLVKMLSTQLEGQFKIESKNGTVFELAFAA